MEKIEAGVNQVDTSTEKVDQEWGEIATDENIKAESEADSKPGESESQPEPDHEETAKKLSGFLKKIFKWSFYRFLPGWKVIESETDKLGDAWSAVIAKYLPARWVRFVPGGGAIIELDAIMVTIDIVEPRLKVPANSENIPAQAAPAIDLSKTDNSENSRKKPESQSGAMKEVHDS